MWAGGLVEGDEVAVAGRDFPHCPVGDDGRSGVDIGAVHPVAKLLPLTVTCTTALVHGTNMTFPCGCRISVRVR